MLFLRIVTACLRSISSSLFLNGNGYVNAGAVAKGSVTVPFLIISNRISNLVAIAFLAAGVTTRSSVSTLVASSEAMVCTFCGPITSLA